MSINKNNLYFLRYLVTFGKNLKFKIKSQSVLNRQKIKLEDHFCNIAFDVGVNHPQNLMPVKNLTHGFIHTTLILTSRRTGNCT